MSPLNAETMNIASLSCFCLSLLLIVIHEYLEQNNVKKTIDRKNTKEDKKRLEKIKNKKKVLFKVNTMTIYFFLFNCRYDYSTDCLLLYKIWIHSMLKMKIHFSPCRPDFRIFYLKKMKRFNYRTDFYNTMNVTLKNEK